MDQALEPAAEDQIELLFPIPLMRSPNLLSQELREAAIGAIRADKVETNLRSEQLFHTTIANPLDSNLFREIAMLATPKLVDFGYMLFGERLNWTVKEMWTNMLEPGGSQAMHSHANSFISGVFYLTPSHPGSRTVFIRPPGGFEYSFRHHTRSAAMGPFNAGKYMLPEADPGDLVLFPSYLYHEVPRNQGDQRITIAFNAIPDRLDCWGYEIKFST
ncbi:hypothetical protein G8O24_19930 [Bradyrhizobium sp. INPA01-394B]|uniref:2OG-Fe(II) oxygenase family protein n=1 Tax=Bradyrhizobium campsiandrae TaxID=1729892 RepID=A0ABR7UB24_9BRAD|nr:2OG-Fe(II) oxygenase family protein [Bradyrhizobium campsiandrae]MBC9879614.1 hypothetical protein [Bradyrhizobium campsiandrae]MBC9980781.1 2OG-Fe(II) oxygenase family protein [Bradyrhizobium campsiandrae]